MWVKRRKVEARWWWLECALLQLSCSDTSIVLFIKLIKNSTRWNKKQSCEVIRSWADGNLNVHPNTRQQAQQAGTFSSRYWNRLPSHHSTSDLGATFSWNKTISLVFVFQSPHSSSTSFNSKACRQHGEGPPTSEVKAQIMTQKLN